MNGKIWIGLALSAWMLGGCGTKPAGGDDTDVDGNDTDVIDTDVVDTDVTLVGCDAVDACDGCQTEGETFTCDCSVNVATDPATCRPIRVLLLDDEYLSYPSSGGFIQPQLEAKSWADGVPMFSVINAGRRWLWNGVLAATPVGVDTADSSDTDVPVGDMLSVDNTDVVFLLEGADYSSELTQEGATALAAFVEAGGGVVRTEWGAAYDQLEPEICPMLEYDDYMEDTDPKTWTLVASSAPLAPVLQADLPATFTLAASIVKAAPKTVADTLDVDVLTVATVTYTDSDPDEEIPALTYWPAVLTGNSPHHGTIVWVNHDLAYLNDDTFTAMQEPEWATLMGNVARAAASRK